MAIDKGDRIPSVTLYEMSADGPVPVSTDEFFGGRKVALFAVPGAFTPGCSQAHMPGFVTNADRILAKGVDRIACVAVNDAFVMDAWRRDQNADAIHALADGNAELTRAMGMDLDASGMGMGTRSKRYALIADDGVVQWLGVDDNPGNVDRSSAETLLGQL